MGKYLILDKSVFEATSTSELEDFAKDHFLILPDVLYYECATTTKNKEELLDRFRAVIVSGAYICISCKDIIKKEAPSFAAVCFSNQSKRSLSSKKNISNKQQAI